MMAHGSTVGVFHLLSHPSPRATGDDEQGVRKLAVAVAEQLSLAIANLRLRETLRDQSIRDPLTGLFNRRYLLETFERELDRARRLGSSVVCAMLDVDHFKRFNDSYGHEAGDRLLYDLGRVLTTGVRRTDIVCRHGGEEFVILMPDTTLSDAHRKLDELREDVARLRVVVAGTAVGASVSVGIAACPEHGSAPDPLLQAADAAMYQSKREGRNRVTVAA